jgi:hypothetical protein
MNNLSNFWLGDDYYSEMCVVLTIPELVNQYNKYYNRDYGTENWPCCAGSPSEHNKSIQKRIFCRLGSRQQEFEAQQLWVGRRDIIMCISRIYNWSLVNQIETDRLRTWPGPDELSELGRFICHCWFDVAGGEPDNGVGRLIMEFAC